VVKVQKKIKNGYGHGIIETKLPTGDVNKYFGVRSDKDQLALE
jgi:hypothetical protein